MHGYVAQRRGRFYAVIYEGRDPVTGKELRRWHPAGTDRVEAERLAGRLAAQEQGRVDATETSACQTETRPASRSTSPQRSPRISPRRMPV